MSVMDMVTPSVSSGEIVRIVVVVVFIKMMDQDLFEWYWLTTAETRIWTSTVMSEEDLSIRTAVVRHQ